MWYFLLLKLVYIFTFLDSLSVFIVPAPFSAFRVSGMWVPPTFEALAGNGSWKIGAFTFQRDKVFQVKTV